MRSLAPTYSSDLFHYSKMQNTLYASYSDMLGCPPIEPLQALDPARPSVLGFNIRSERTGQVMQFMLDHEDENEFVLVSTGNWFAQIHRQITLKVVLWND